MTIGQKVRQARIARGLTLEQLAQLAGVSLATVNRIEAGRHLPRLDSLVAVAAALAVEVQDLLATSQDDIPKAVGE